MILLHRITPFLIGLCSAVMFAMSAVLASWVMWVMPICIGVCLWLLVRLSGASREKPEAWVMVATPFFLLLSSALLFLFLDSALARSVVGVVTSVLLYFFTEQVFRYVHLPVVYQAYSLQNLGGIMSVLSLFLFVAGGHALLLFVRFPLVWSSITFFVLTFFITLSALWISNVPKEMSGVYALGAAIIFTELFAVTSYLPSSFFTNAALLAVFYYLYLGIGRAQALTKLSRLVVRRYIGVGAVMMLAVLLTAQWG